MTDDGRGLSEDEAARLFQPFTILGPQGRHTGSGLGLFICKGLIEAQGGRIWCQSAGPGMGSTFTFTLPKA